MLSQKHASNVDAAHVGCADLLLLMFLKPSVIHRSITRTITLVKRHTNAKSTSCKNEKSNNLALITLHISTEDVDLNNLEMIC